LAVVETQDGESTNHEAGILCEVPAPRGGASVMREAVDLHDEATSDPSVHAMTVDDGLLHDADAGLPHQRDEHGLDPRVGQAGRKVSETPSAGATPLHSPQRIDVDPPVPDGRFPHGEGIPWRRAARDVEQHVHEWIDALPRPYRGRSVGPVEAKSLVVKA
jgi:hypothetical protein